jgi:hypothetical protein
MASIPAARIAAQQERTQMPMARPAEASHMFS